MAPRRLLNLAHGIIADGVAYDEEARDAFHEAMEWPDVLGDEEETEQDKSARHAAALIGAGNVDEMVMRAWEAQQRLAADAAPAEPVEEAGP